MSVINKMLRDLDHRHAESTSASDGGAEPVASGLGEGPLRGGTSAIHWGASDAGVQPGSGSRLLFWVGSIGALVAAITGGWLWMQSQHANPTPTPIASKPAQTPTPSASAPAVEVAVQEESKPETTVAPTAMVLRMEESLSARRALDALLSSPTPTPKASTPPPTTSQTGASTFAVSAQKASASAATTGAPVPPVANSPRPASVVTKAPVAAPPVDAPAVGAQRQQLAGGEALAQAQGHTSVAAAFKAQALSYGMEHPLQEMRLSLEHMQERISEEGTWLQDRIHTVSHAMDDIDRHVSELIGEIQTCTQAMVLFAQTNEALSLAVKQLSNQRPDYRPTLPHSNS